MSRQIKSFNILLSKRSLIHRDISNKGKPMREFDIGDLVVVRKQVKSSRKEGVAHNLGFKTKGPCRVP